MVMVDEQNANNHQKYCCVLITFTINCEFKEINFQGVHKMDRINISSQTNKPYLQNPQNQCTENRYI